MLLEFYGKECPHCIKIAPLIERLRKDSGVEVKQYEVWHNSDNLDIMQKYDMGLCGGVPFLYNTDNAKFICGEATYEEVKDWAAAPGEKLIGHSPVKLDFSYIADGIYIGTNQCCREHFDAQLKSEGILADISIEENKIDMPFGVDYYLWLPVMDKQAPTQGQLAVGVSTLQKLVALNEKAYVHCARGHGRSPTLVAAYFIKKGMGVGDAIDLIKEKRPSIHLEDAQIKALEEFSIS